MHIFATLLSILLFSISSFGAYAASRDEVLTEVQLREKPNILAQSIVNTLPQLPQLDSAETFDKFTQSYRLPAAELIRNIQLTARLKMELYNKEKDRYLAAKSLIEQLAHISHSPFDKSYLLMLKGRYLGHSQQDYAGAIEYYQQAIPLIEQSTVLADQVLLYTLQEHLSMMHMIMRQKESALIHLKKLISTAKKFENNYLTAHAESVLGKYFYKQNQLGKSLSHYTEAVKYTRGGKNPSQNAHIELQLARVYRDLASWDEALKSANKAADAFTQLGNLNYVSSSMTVIAMIYANQDLWYQAIDYHLNAQQIETQLGNYIGLGLNLHNIGEAYFKIGDTQNSLSNLKQANAIFTSKKAEHYLVYNDLLIAEVTASVSQWQESQLYATKAAKIAESKQLNEELKEALERQAYAQEQLGLYEQAYNSIQQLQTLNSQATPQASELDKQRSQVKEQKLKLKISKLQNELQDKSEQLNITRLVSILCVFPLCLLILLSVKQWRIKNKLATANQELQATQLLEPFTQKPSYLSFKLNFENQNEKQQKTLALVSLSAQLDSDLTQGFECNADMNRQQLLAIKNALDCKAYIIRPGVFLISLDSIIEANQLLAQLRDIIDSNHGQTSIHMGILHRPLLADLAIKLSAEQHFLSLQMMLSAARTLGLSQDYFVTMKTLNFASAGIFNKPLYLNIEKSIVRGIVKIETNGDKDNIVWPRWKIHQNIDINDDKVDI